MPRFKCVRSGSFKKCKKCKHAKCHSVKFGNNCTDVHDCVVQAYTCVPDEVVMVKCEPCRGK